MVRMTCLCLASAALGLAVALASCTELAIKIHARQLASPLTPSNLSGVALDTTRIRLSWSDQSSNETGFEIQRASTVAGGDWSAVAQAARELESWDESGLAVGTTYYYRIRAINDAGNSEWLGPASVTTDNGGGLGTWQVMGTAAASNGTATMISLAVDGGIPYIAYSAQNLMGVKVRSLSGGVWASIGTDQMPTYSLTALSLAFDSPTPYYAFSMTGDSSAVFHYTGTDWAGDGDFTGALVFSLANVVLGIDAGTAYVAYTTGTGAYVAKYAGASVWTQSTSFSGQSAMSGTIGLGFYGANVYACYINAASNYAASASTYPVSWAPPLWTYLMDGGNNFFSPMTLSETTMVIAGGIPYVAYTGSGTISVKKYNGSAWVLVGSANFASGSLARLAKDSGGAVYLAYKDSLNGNRITVRKFGGSNWVTVGTAGFSGQVGSYLAFAVSQSDGVPYVAYDNLDNTSQAQVMGYQ